MSDAVSAVRQMVVAAFEGEPPPADHLCEAIVASLAACAKRLAQAEQPIDDRSARLLTRACCNLLVLLELRRLRVVRVGDGGEPCPRR